MRLHIELLGKFGVTVGDSAIPASAWRRERSAALVKLLAVTPAHRLHREQVMDRFWPELDRDAAGANLRKAVHFARRALGEHELIESSEVIALAPELVVDTDAFDAAATAALVSSDPALCVRAADLYRGELLPDDRYVEWLDEPRKQLHQRYVRVLRAGKLWDKLIAVEPTDEQAQCARMQAALDAGRRGEAIRLFQDLRERLSVDLGVGPSREAVALHDRALTATTTEPISVTDRIRASLAWGLVALHSGDFAKAESAARESRELAFGVGLAREMGEATALLGMVAHTQGRWSDLFRAEVGEWVQAASTFTSNIFDGHLCLAEFCLASPTGHDAMTIIAHELLARAELASSSAARGLATMILGDLERCAGRLDEAERLLIEADQHHADAGASAGRVLVLERLAHIALSRARPAEARALIERGVVAASSTWLVPHLQIRMKALAVQSAATPEDVANAIVDGDRVLVTACQPCSMSFRTASAIALAEAGELDQVSRRLDEAERLAGMWNGGPWVAALWEARGVFRRAQGNEERASASFSEAAARFAELHRPLDHARCAARAGSTPRYS